LGFEVNEGEYKVMGMAAYGAPRFIDKVWKTVRPHDDGSYWMDPAYFAYHRSTRRVYTSKFLELFGKPRDPTVPFLTRSNGPASQTAERLCEYNQYYADIAASIQLVTEELILQLAREVQRETGLKRLCLAGGVALNSVANARILRETPVEELYVQPSAGDGGGALGAALVASHCALGNPRRFVMDHAYWGQGYASDEIHAAITHSGFRYDCIEDESRLIDLTVDHLASAKVVGWFQGRFEWGPRALGNRSILADPRRSEMKDMVNQKIKFREPFRPFAPAVVAEAAEQYFELKSSINISPTRFMLMVVPTREKKQHEIPAVTHMGTARVQTVHPEVSPLFHKLIGRFGEATGVPVVLNTSFNVQGEPIVNTPEDALNTFANSGMDTLVMGKFVIHKSDGKR
jgi:carbamoyltransferase